MKARTLTILATTLVLSACGTFQLASGVVPRTTKTQEQQQLDNLSCKDRAKLEANTADRQAGAFLLGLTIVGAPVAHELEKSKQRQVYKDCMEAKGYTVLPPADVASSGTPVGTPPGTPGVAPTSPRVPVGSVPAPAPTASTQPEIPSPPAKSDDAVMQLQRLKELRDKGLLTEQEYEQKRKAIVDKL